MQFQKVLEEYGQALRPMRDAPRDRRTILAHAPLKGLIICRWEQEPDRLIGPLWMERPDADRGFQDRYFTGWLETTAFKPLDRDAVRRLLIAYIDGARAAGDPLTMLGDSYPRQANDR